MTRIQGGHGPKRVAELSERVAASNGRLAAFSGQLVLDYRNTHDIAMRTMDELAVYECKWTNMKIDRTTVEDLASKALNLKPDRLGFFSKAGYIDGLDPAHQYFTVDDLYHITASK